MNSTIAKRSNGSHRWLVTSRVLAAFIPTFVLTNTLGIFTVLALPVDNLTAIPYVAVFAFLFYTLLVMWIFHAKSLKKIWSFLMLAIAVSSVGCYLLLQLENTI